jgi:hypothetical protein
MKARPVTHAGRDLPERKKSTELDMPRLARKPMPRTNAK